MALGGALGSVLVTGDAAALCVAGVALGDVHLRIVRQAWRNFISTAFACQARRLWHWVARLGRF